MNSHKNPDMPNETNFIPYPSLRKLINNKDPKQ